MVTQTLQERLRPEAVEILGPAVAETVRKIDEYDYTFLQKRLVGEGIVRDEQEFEEGLAEYKAFIAVAVATPGRTGMVSTEVDDKFWHNHILFTKQYAEFGEQVAGRFLSHSPNMAKYDQLNLEAKCGEENCGDCWEDPDCSNKASPTNNAYHCDEQCVDDDDDEGMCMTEKATYTQKADCWGEDDCTQSCDETQRMTPYQKADCWGEDDCVEACDETQRTPPTMNVPYEVSDNSVANFRNGYQMLFGELHSTWTRKPVLHGECDAGEDEEKDKDGEDKPFQPLCLPG